MVLEVVGLHPPQIGQEPLAGQQAFPGAVEGLGRQERVAATQLVPVGPLGPAGESKLFQGAWLRSIFRKVTWRERWDLVDDIGMFTCNDFNEFLKGKTDMYAGGYSSIWEGG